MIPADRGVLPVPVGLLPRPRLIVWHGDIEGDHTDPSAAALAILRRAYWAVIDHGLPAAGVGTAGSKIAGGNDWTGWHVPDAGVIAGLADVARAIGPAWWHIVHEPGDGWSIVGWWSIVRS